MKVFSFLFPPPVFAQTTPWSGKCIDGDVATIAGLECLFANILSIATSFAGLAFFIMLLAGGFKYLLAGGDQKQTAAASATLTHALIGLVLTIAVWLILKFIEIFTGIEVTRFQIG